MLWMFIACNSGPEELADPQLLTRLSIDLRGVRPSIEELRQSEEGRWSLETTVNEWRQDIRFGRVSAERWAHVFDTRQDETLFSADELGLDDEFAFAYSVGDEPIRMMETVIHRNLPWTDIVTADWTVLNASLFDVYPADWVDTSATDNDDWQVARYNDGRPNAGLLVSNGLWWRYDTSLNNASRKRANQLSRIFLCRDYLELPVSFDSSVDITNEVALQNAIENHPGCVSCHATLDPLAAFLGGVFARRKSDPLEMIYYHPERESLAAMHLGVEPAWNGQSGNNLEDLGVLFSQDPNFSKCTTERFAASLLGRTPDEDNLNVWLSSFRTHQNAGQLIQEIVLSDVYRLRTHDTFSTMKRVSATQLESIVTELTGFTMVSDGYAMLRADGVGYASMIEGDTASLPLILLQQELAHLAGRFWFLESSNAPFEPNSLSDVQENVEMLHLRILGVEPTKQEMQDLEQYIQLLEPLYPTSEIWASVATVLMQDPRFWVY